MKRWRLALVVGMVLAISVAAAWLLRETATPLPVRAYSRVRLGMTLDEVENAIGCPAECYGIQLSMRVAKVERQTGLRYESLCDGPGRRFIADREQLTVERWTWDEHCIWVAFDGGGRVVGAYLLEDRIWQRAGFFDRMKMILEF